MPKRAPSNAELLILLPWWVSAILAALAYFGLALILPALETENILYLALQNNLPRFAPLAAFFFLALAGISALRAWRSRKLVDQQTGLASLCNLPWKAFEDLVAEVYRRKGYRVEESLGGGADGGIDLVLRKDGEKILVQCKRWKNKSVGAPIVRELYGLMTAESAKAATLVTTSGFTRDAEAFAVGKPINLIDGPALLGLVNGVQKGTVETARLSEQNKPVPPIDAPAGISGSETPSCPSCGSSMVLRTARRGDKQGQGFWGCSGYPKCRGTRPASPASAGAV
jgi:restriction system protein